MADAWFVIVCVLLVGYVVLDGFDFGAGALHRVVAREDAVLGVGQGQGADQVVAGLGHAGLDGGE